MQLERPKPQIRRTYVTAIDPDTRESKSTTVYDSTPEKVIAEFERMVREKQPRRERRAVSA